MQLNQIHKCKSRDTLKAQFPAAHPASTTQTKTTGGINQKVSVCTQASHSRRVQNTDICNVGENKGQ